MATQIMQPHNFNWGFDAAHTLPWPPPLNEAPTNSHNRDDRQPQEGPRKTNGETMQALGRHQRPSDRKRLRSGVDSGIA